MARKFIMEEKSETSTKEGSSGFLDMIPTFSKFLGPPFIVKKSFVCIVVRSFLLVVCIFMDHGMHALSTVLSC